MREFLLLCNRPASGSNADTISEHIDAICRMPGFHVRQVSFVGDIPAFVDLDQFDAIGIHYSIHVNDPSGHFLSSRAMERLARYKGHKCVWMHDEYRFVNNTIDKLDLMGIDTLFTVIPQASAEKIYDRSRLPNTKVVTVLTGYVSPKLEMIAAPVNESRPVDVSYRARRPPFWLGELGQEKIQIGERFLEESKVFDLVADISVEEADRLYGQDWLDLLLRSKSGLSSESGASIVDFTGEIERDVDAYVKINPQAKFVDVQHITGPVDNVHVINCISPRIFEMIACRTVVIAFPGGYSGVIQPWVHYVPLEKDFSNLSEVIQAVNDPVMRQCLAERAYQDIIVSGRYRYEKFSMLCANALDVPERTGKVFRSARFLIGLYASPTYLIGRFAANIFQKYIMASPLRSVIIRAWLKLPSQAQKIIKPLLRVIGR